MSKQQSIERAARRKSSANRKKAMSFDSGLFAQIPNEEVDAAIPTLCPHYHAAMTVLAEVAAWGEEGFPGASLEDMVRIATNSEPEKKLIAIRLRAEKNANRALGLPQRRERPWNGAYAGRLPGWSLRKPPA
jgi:hypothetical protein